MKKFYYVTMSGSYENCIWFPFETKEKAQEFVNKEIKRDKECASKNSWTDRNNRDYDIEEYNGELIEFGYAE